MLFADIFSSREKAPSQNFRQVKVGINSKSGTQMAWPQAFLKDLFSPMNSIQPEKNHPQHG